MPCATVMGIKLCCENGNSSLGTNLHPELTFRWPIVRKRVRLNLMMQYDAAVMQQLAVCN